MRTGSNPAPRSSRHSRRRSATPRQPKLAKEAIATGLTVRELVVKKGLLAGNELEEVLDLRAMTEIGIPGGKPLPGGG